MKTADQPATPQANLTAWIMLAVLVWGFLLALGTYQFGGNQPMLKAAIVGGCTLAFLGLWLAALALRQRRLKS